ncbi:hypothetical protein ACIP39_38995 [Streptomyces tibetensis]|uniref:hypothetical protein n=1 Tax=Streptomyces tibetensis TaxID=2382123 RepID=UPI003823A078
MSAGIQHEEIGGKTATVTVDGEPVEMPKRTTPNAVLGNSCAGHEEEGDRRV